MNTYGVKVIHTHAVGVDGRLFYEELILKVNASSFDEAYEKAERYMQDSVSEYTNPHGETVRTVSVEAVDCFLAFEEKGDVQEMFSSFSANHTSLSEEEYYRVISSPCDEDELHSLRNKDFN